MISALALLALTPSAEAATQVFRPAADAHVTAASPARNYGASKTLQADASPNVKTYLRFDVRGLEGNVTSATLRLTAGNTTSGELRLHGVSDTSWGERTITFSNASGLGPVVAESGSTTAGGEVEMDATPLVSADGVISVALTTPNTGTPRKLFSRESPLESPRLVVETDAPNDPVIAAAGDTACAPTGTGFNGGAGTTGTCRQRWTADLLADGGLEAVLPLGDNQYELATLPEFQSSYDLSWGQFNSISHPVAGDHEYDSGSPSGYFDYFNGPGVFSGPAGDRDKGYYSYDVGAWHLIALNSNCEYVACVEGSPQNDWLEADLAANPSACTLAYFHAPRFTSGYHRNNPISAPLWEDLYAAGADVILSASDHAYERFARQDPNANPDPQAGTRQFIVGTGGNSHPPPDRAPAANSGIRNAKTFGVLALTLHPTSYSWRFVPESIGSFTDTGSDTCTGPTIDTEPPSAPRALDAAALTRRRISLSWERSTDNDGVASYRVRRDGVDIATLRGGNSFIDKGLQAGTSYTYRVIARDAVGNDSAPSEIAGATAIP